jgi:hypothetical protein
MLAVSGAAAARGPPVTDAPQAWQNFAFGLRGVPQSLQNREPVLADELDIGRIE